MSALPRKADTQFTLRQVRFVPQADNQRSAIQVGRPSGVYRSDTCELPIQPDRADEGRTGKLAVIDVVDFQPASVDVSPLRRCLRLPSK